MSVLAPQRRAEKQQRARKAPRPRPAAKQKAQRPARPRHQIRPGDPEETMAIASSATAVIAIVCAWMLLQLLVLGGLAEQRSQHLLYAQFRSELAQATAPTGELDFNQKPIVPGSPVALLSIPKLGTEQVVVDGTASGDLMAGPGHLRTTPMPGAAGISVVMGRGSTYGAPFGDLDKLTKGDVIEVRNAGAKVSYTVQDVRAAGDPIPAAPTGATAGRLTLVSARGGGPLSALRPGSAVYVDALTDKATPAGPVAAALPPAEQAMARDTAALPLLVLLLAALAGLVLAVSIARRHVRAVLVWTCAAPVAIALAWAVTDQVTRLLPNLM